MKSTFLIFLIVLSSAVIAGNEVNQLNIGDKASNTEVKMQDVSGKFISINEVKKENGILVLFSCNACPFVLRWEGRYREIKKWADENKVGMLVLNSNHQKRNGDDSYEAMKKHALEKKYNFYYALDKESLLANSFGGQTTPHAFLLNSDLRLVYKGAIDDNYKSASEVKTAYLKDAITSLAKGEKVKLDETQPVGCSIKRKLD